MNAKNFTFSVTILLFSILVLVNSLPQPDVANGINALDKRYYTTYCLPWNCPSGSCCGNSCCNTPPTCGSWCRGKCVNNVCYTSCNTSKCISGQCCVWGDCCPKTFYPNRCVSSNCPSKSCYDAYTCAP